MPAIHHHLRHIPAAAILLAAGTGAACGFNPLSPLLGMAGLALCYAWQARPGKEDAAAREAQARWRESELKFLKVFQASPTPVVITRMSDTVIVAANDAFLKTTGYTSDEVIGRTSAALNLYAASPQREEFILAIRTHGFVRDREQLLRTKTGEARTILLSGELIELDGQPHLLTGGQDITERKAAEAGLLKALAREKELNEMKSNFVSMVSHEFRTPLEVIQSSADILDLYLERLQPDERTRHLAWIQDSVRRMAGMMEDVLLLGRFESESCRCQPDDLHLVNWCQRLANELHSATAGRCPIQVTFGEFEPMVSADESLLRHILSNLLSNAVKYSPPETPVRLHVSRDGGSAVFTVADKGCGIPEADRQRLFEAFHRGRNVGQIPGTGLGLVIVKRAVDLHGGSMDFTTSEGGGTSFEVRLPLFETSTPRP